MPWCFLVKKVRFLRRSKGLSLSPSLRNTLLVPCIVIIATGMVIPVLCVTSYMVILLIGRLEGRLVLVLSQVTMVMGEAMVIKTKASELAKINFPLKLNIFRPD